ncbi:peptide chain release factor 2 [Candidatus Uhrbacteria bacterium CG_4_9_14_3_um_filter_50_9]|uniref:Peptide chain release factor 2 n=1 Tax=Candidatus Uhrbacteria bacterium CG_4_9_14_3_um_filter_50_9 TaxID=1975035 RepID=A0A2M7XB63_9BACT|nr:MAG: peptide chain release factor 2 [Candidatus Uhrbacteria bacterium CG_4_9_14_3_um_filter_50_9]
MLTSKTSRSAHARRGGYFDLDAVETQIKTLDVEMTAPDFWNDQEQAQRVSKQTAALRSEVEQWKGFLGEVADVEEFAALAETQGDESLYDDIASKLKDLKERFSKMEFATLFASTYDKDPAIISIHAGSGGTEAQDWTEMLLRMFARFAEQKDWDVRILDESRAEDVGLKSVTVRVEGRWAYGYFRSEAGVHRLVRISPFDAEKMRHTTFALVEVIPELDDVSEIEIDQKDLRIDTFLSSGKGGQSVNTTYSAVRIVHLPTKIAVSCQNERSQQQNKETAMKVLKSKLHQIQLEKQQKKKDALRGEYTSAEWGNQIRSYVLHPYKLVKDHRTNHETSDTQGVLDGELEPFMEAFLRWELEQSDRFEEANRDND